MKANDISCRKTIKNSLITLRQILPSVFLFEIVYKLLTRMIFRPLLSFIIQAMLSLNGKSAVFNENILSFFTSITGLIAGVLLIIFAAVLVYFEFSTIIILAYYKSKGRNKGLLYAMKMSLTTLGDLFNTGILGFSCYALLLLPFVNLGISSTLLPQLDIPNFVMGELSKSLYGSIALLAVSAAAVIIVVRLTFLLPVMALERLNFWKSLKRAFRIMKQTPLKIVIIYGFFVLIWFISLMIPWVLLALFLKTDSVVLLNVKEIFNTYQFTWKSFAIGAAAVLTEILQIILTPMMLTLDTILYSQTDDRAELKEGKIVGVEYRLQRFYNIIKTILRYLVDFLVWINSRFDKIPFIKKHKGKIIAVLCILLTVFSVQFFQQAEIRQIQPIILGHRGSGYGVENTIEAIQSAIDSNAEYAEIDILLSKDNVPVVIHDTNLKRLSGVNGKVYDYTAAELTQFTLKQNGYESRISTLEEVIQYCSGKIKLLIEFKLHGHETADLIDTTMKVVEDNQFNSQCIFHTLDYELTQQLKTNYPDYPIGYVIYGNVGNLNRSKLLKLNVDFLSVEEGFITNKIIKACHRADMAIYAWTANEKENMERFLKMGVDGVITDHPQTGVEILKQMSSNARSSLVE